MKETTIVYMAAGMSSRFGGKIKQFALVGPKGETLIEYSMNQAIKAGFNRIVFIVGEMTEKPFKEKFGNNYKGIPIAYALQQFDHNSRDKPWGTLDSLACTRNIVYSPFVVCNGDDIYGENAYKTLFNHLQKYSTAATTYYKLGDVIPKIGKINRGHFKIKDGKVIDIYEVYNIDSENLSATNSNPNDPVSMTFFALHPEVLQILAEINTNFKKNHVGDRKSESLLPTELGNLIKEKKLIMQAYPANSLWFGVTNPDDEAVVREKLKQLRN